MWFLRRRGSESEDEAAKALKEAQEKLLEVQRRGAEVSKVASELKDIRERNHFAEQLEDLLIRHKRPLHDS